MRINGAKRTKTCCMVFMTAWWGLPRNMRINGRYYSLAIVDRFASRNALTVNLRLEARARYTLEVLRRPEHQLTEGPTAILGKQTGILAEVGAGQNCFQVSQVGRRL